MTRFPVSFAQDQLLLLPDPPLAYAGERATQFQEYPNDAQAYSVRDLLHNLHLAIRVH